MEQPTVLRTTKIGGGFVKEDVLTYLDELNTKIEGLEKELQESKGPAQPAVDPHEIAKYRNQIDSLQEKLNKSNQILRETKKENDELKAGKPVSAANPQMQAALDSARKEIENLKGQLKNANAKGAGQGSASLEAARKEVDNLRVQLKASEQKNSELKAALAEQKSAGGGQADNTALNAELAKVKQEITKINAELKTKTDQLNAKTKELAEKDIKITELTKNVKSSAEKDAEIAQLKEKLSNPTALLNDLMNGILNNAQESAEKSKKEAKEEAEKTVKEATEKADKIIKEANEKAKKTVDTANADAEKTINEANNKASKLNEMSSTVRTMILNEIESVNNRFTSLSDAINKLTAQTSDKINEVKTVIDEARKAVESNESNTIKLEKIPQAEVKNAAPQNNVTSKKSIVPPAMDSFDDIIVKPVNNNGPFNRGNTNAQNQVKQTAAPKKPVSNFGFDMDELLKAAEAEAANSTD